jgi:hypothetical protein
MGVSVSFCPITYKLQVIIYCKLKWAHFNFATRTIFNVNSTRKKKTGKIGFMRCRITLTWARMQWRSKGMANCAYARGTNCIGTQNCAQIVFLSYNQIEIFLLSF